MILHALAPGHVGGLESVVRLLAAGQARRGHAVAAVLVLDPGAEAHPLIEPLSASGVQVVPLVVPARAYHTEWKSLRAVIRRLAPDVVHTHGYRADVLAGAAARRGGVPAVTTVHGFTGGGRKNRLYEWLQVRSFRQMAAVVAVSRPLVDRLAAEGVPRDRIACIPNAWAPSAPAYGRDEARRRLAIASGSLVVGWVGRIGHEKGADVFVRALAELDDHRVTASIIGDGRERPAVEALARELGVAGRIAWHGTLPDAGRYTSAFDVFALSSRTEGTPIALFEAMSASLPIVGTSVGGVPDVLEHGACGLLVPPEDPSALAAALATLVADPAAARARADAAFRRLADKYGIEPWLDRYDALYDGIRQR